VNNIFIKNGIGHLILEVENKENIKFLDFFPFGNTILEVIKDYNTKMNQNLDYSDLVVKSTLNSPGKIEIIGAIKTVGVISAIIVGLTGGGFKIHFGHTEINLHTDGIISKVIQYEDHEQDRQIKRTLNKKLQNLKIKSPDDATKIIHALDSKTEDQK